MAWPLKSSVKNMLMGMLSKFTEIQKEMEADYAVKKGYFDEIIASAENLEDFHDRARLLTPIKKLMKFEEENLLRNETQYVERIAFLTDVPERSLWRLKKEMKKAPEQVTEVDSESQNTKKPRLCNVPNLDSFDIAAIKNKINEFYTVKKQVPTLQTLLPELKEAIGFKGCRETLRQILHKNGFVFKKNRSERTDLIDRTEISQWREKYLREIYTKRQEGKPIIYLDETYVHLNYKVKKSWQGPSVKGVTEKISPGKRYIVVHAGSEKGWVPNALLVFSTKSKSADYHHDMNAQNFTKWLKEKLIPNLQEPSVIVMDNAKYHVKQINKPPTSQDLKATIQNWLTCNGIPFEPTFTKEKLMILVNQNKSPAIYETEEILKANGHKVLKLPPYHCDLNAIELAWSMAKRNVARRNLGIPAADMEQLITDCFLSVTEDQWKRFTDHVVRVESEYRNKDKITADNFNRFIIHVDDESDSETDTASVYDDVEYLESDYEDDM